MRSLVTKRFFGFLMIPLLALSLFACAEGGYESDDNRKSAVATREAVFDRAERMWPAPTDLINFPIREALVKFTERQDLVNHPWYTYILSMNGNYIGYFVTQTYPVSVCNFLSSTERFVDLPDGVWGNAIAPSYDGIFYGGGGSSAACEGLFFFDTVTDAMYTFGGPLGYFTSDAPLNIDVPQIQPSNQ